MLKHFFLSSILLCSNTFLFAQSQDSPTSSELLQQIKKLNTLGTVLYIAAHPDDENTRLLAYLANEKNYRTAYLSLTRGGGGQNLVGKEQGPALGVLRTQELLAARKIDKAEQYFSEAVDFGYSKTPEETFSFWNKEKILSNVVYVIRKLKPDVIICRFPTTGEGGHGHHTASAILALEAFDAAADPKRFPEQLKEVKIWKSKRLFWNTYKFSSTNTTAPDQLQIDVGGYNSLIGKSYGEIASESRSCHKSQGFGVAKQRGSNIEYFKLLKGDSVSTDLFDGISTSWNRFSNCSEIQKSLDVCFKEFDAESPQTSVPLLTSIYQQILALDEKQDELKYWKEQKLGELKKLLLHCAGIWLEASASDYRGVPGEAISITTQIINRNTTLAQLNSISYFQQSDTLCNLTLPKNTLFTFKHKKTLSSTLAYSSPYWLNKTKSEKYSGEAEKLANTIVSFNLNLAGLNLIIEQQLVYKHTDPVKGEVYRPFEIVPPVTVNMSDNAFVFLNGDTKTILFTIKSNTPKLKGKLEIKCSEGWQSSIKNPDFYIENLGDEMLVEATVSGSKNSKEGNLQAQIQYGTNLYNQSIQRIEYDHIPHQFILSAAEAKLVNCAIQTNTLKIAYIEGAGDAIPEALKQIGLEVTTLNDELLSKQNLSEYDCLITGVRAYNSNKRLSLYHSKLMEFVKSGGNLIVQYNTNNNLGSIKTSIGPYPFTISRDRVTDENSIVKFLNPKHPAFTTPNTITEKDFENWVQERGIYFATEVDEHYFSFLGMNDLGEKEKTGSLIIAPFGKGNFVYTGLSFFRQLPAGVPGAYRLFINLLNLPKN